MPGRACGDPSIHHTSRGTSVPAIFGHHRRQLQTSENGEPAWTARPIVRGVVRQQKEGAMARTGYGRGKRCSCKIVNSPVGTLTLVATAEGLAGILWENERPGRVRLNVEVEDASHPVLVETERQLAEYFAGQRKAFAVVLDFAGTAFQRKVWNALLTIPFGETRSYRQIATPDWPSRRRPRRWCGKRQEPRVDHRALPSRRRHQRQTHRVCRRARRQGVSARPRRHEADDAPGCVRRRWWRAGSCPEPGAPQSTGDSTRRSPRPPTSDPRAPGR